MPPAAKRNAVDWALLVALGLLWGSAFSMTKIAVTSISPIWVVALRCTVAAAFLGLVLLARRSAIPRGPRHWAWFAWLGIVGYVLPLLLLSWGTQFLDSGLVGILIGSVPIFMLTLAHFLLPDEPLNRYRVVGFAVGFAGIVVLIGPQSLLQLSTGGLVLLAELAILCTAVLFAVQLITVRIMPPAGAMTRAFCAMLIASFVSVPVALYLEPQGPAGATMASWAAAIGLGIVPTAGATVLSFYMLGRTGTAFVALSNYLIPAFALAAGMIVLSEWPDIRTLGGFALILLGIAIAERRIAGR